MVETKIESSVHDWTVMPSGTGTRNRKATPMATDRSSGTGFAPYHFKHCCLSNSHCHRSPLNCDTAYRPSFCWGIYCWGGFCSGCSLHGNHSLLWHVGQHRSDDQADSLTLTSFAVLCWLKLNFRAGSQRQLPLCSMHTRYALWQQSTSEQTRVVPSDRRQWYLRWCTAEKDTACE